MLDTAYEERLFGRSSFANDDQPQRPNVIDQAVEAIGGRGHYRHSWKGHEIWHMGRWNGPYKLDEFIRQANIRLKAEGKPQITVNPAWEIEDSEGCHVIA